jgi:predicted Zn-dependent peptidase
MARKYLRPEDMTFVIVGDKKTVEPQLKEAGMRVSR